MYRTRRDASTSLPALRNMQTAVNRLFDDAFDDVFGAGQQRTRAWSPPVEIFDADDDLVFLLEVPGFERDQINISFENGQLTFAGERQEPDREGRSYHRNERWFGRFERSFQLPVSVDPEKISANLQNGVLKVVIPKKEEAKARQISVKVS